VAQIEALQEQVGKLEAVNDALGKAIGLLHKANEQEPGSSTTTGPDDSLPTKTSW
jgi:hypothetical protein